MTTRNGQLVHLECEHTIVNMTDNTTTVHSGPAQLVAVYVNTVLSANACPIENVAGTTVVELIASLAAGSMIDFHGLHFPDALIINPADAAASGQICVLWRKVNPG